MGFSPLVEMSRLETVFVHVPIIATNEATGIVIDPTADSVTMAFTQGKRLPDTPTWYTADWATITNADGTKSYYARALVGPAGVIALTRSPTWWAHAKVVDNPQIPICTAARSFRVR